MGLWVGKTTSSQSETYKEIIGVGEEREMEEEEEMVRNFPIENVRERKRDVDTDSKTRMYEDSRSTCVCVALFY